MDGIKSDILIFKAKNELSHKIFLLLFEGHSRNALEAFLCNYIYSHSALTFLADSSRLYLQTKRDKRQSC
jgi:hypothetical protein